MTTVFDLDLVKATAAIATMTRAPDGVVAIAGDAWTHGAMATLLRAEFLAAQAGVVPWFQDPESGALGVLSIGAARERIQHAPEDVRTMYLGTHALIGRTHATALLWDGKTSVLSGFDEESALAEPVTGTAILVAVVVVAIAGILAGAWYLNEHATIETDGRNLRTTAVAFDLLELARGQLATTGKIDPKLWEVFKTLADSERPSNATAYSIAAAVLAAAIGAGYLAWSKSREPDAADRRRSA